MLDDDRFLEAFEACAVDELRHHDHVRLAWVMLRRDALEDTLGRFSSALRRFAAHQGADGLYHQTITWTYLFAINERMKALGPDHDWPAFRDANPDLFASHRDFLERYYTPEVLDSELARREYVLPDRGYRLAA
jgi:hypothetical protein